MYLPETLTFNPTPPPPPCKCAQGRCPQRLAGLPLSPFPCLPRATPYPHQPPHPPMGRLLLQPPLCLPPQGSTHSCPRRRLSSLSLATASVASRPAKALPAGAAAAALPPGSCSRRARAAPAKLQRRLPALHLGNCGPLGKDSCLALSLSFSLHVKRFCSKPQHEEAGSGGKR